MSSDPAFRVPVRSVPVVIRCRGQESFNASFACLEAGDNVDAVRFLLGTDDEFLAAADPLTGHTRLLSKSHVQVVEVYGADSTAEAAALPSPSLHDVRVRLVDSTTISGALVVSGPVGRERVSDELNRGPRFLELRCQDVVMLVNRDAIVTLWDTPSE